MDATSRKLNERFKVPEHYQKVSLPVQVDFKCEDIDDAKEFWLIRVPSGLDISSLEHNRISLTHATEYNKTENTKLICYPSKNSDVKNLTVLLPNTHENSMAPVKQQLCGQITIFEQIALPNFPPFAMEAHHPLQVPQDLKQRYIPFGSGRVLPNKNELDHISETVYSNSDEDMGELHLFEESKHPSPSKMANYEMKMKVFKEEKYINHNSPTLKKKKKTKDGKKTDHKPKKKKKKKEK